MAESAPAPTVLVTGASGFIATHLIKQLQTLGKYSVRGTVRSLKNEEKVKELKGLVPDAAYPLELVEADLTKEEGWKEVVQGCTYVYHLASPFPLSNPRNEDDLIVPAVNGTLNVLKACAEAGTVKRVVVTSSCAAIGNTDDSHVLTESDWISEEDASAYYKSKLRAERAAWDFVEKMGDEKKFELAVVNPAFVVGPFLTNTNSGSFDMMKSILTKQVSAIPAAKFGIVHVRDVVAGHIAAMETPEAAGNRHILVGSEMWMKEMVEIISREFSPQGYKIPLMSLPKFLAWPLKFFNADIKAMYPSLGKDIRFNTDRMRNVLKIEPLSVADGVIQSCYCLIEMGIVPKTPEYLGPPESRKPQESSGGEKKEESSAGEKKEESSAEQPPAESSEQKEEVKDQPLEENQDQKNEEKDKKEEDKSADTPAEPEVEEKPEDIPESEAPKEEDKPEDKPESKAPKDEEEKPEDEPAEEDKET